MTKPYLIFVKSVSLVHVKRIGLENWANREWWLKRKVAIRSEEHRAWWRDGGAGYVTDTADAWVLDFADAYETTKHCGPEKKISYNALPLVHGPAIIATDREVQS